MPLLLVTGGSQGARHLNQVVCQALPALLQQCQVLQISGDKLFNETQTLAEQYLSGVPEETRQRYKLVAYMNEEMPVALQAAEIVLGRSGASMLSELAVLGKPAILVPLPPAIGDSPQETNAAMLADKHAAEVILDNNLKPELLIERITDILSSKKRLQEIADAIQKLAKPDATKEIVDTLIQLASSVTGAIAGHESVQV
jgi:UDP-N-acetylglucosamine--N-acetylmuramyl-(pentapeptide) pyrophosphoryl-undecaprenol N-acetylglucosamine transferase